MKVALLTPTKKSRITDRVSTFEDACNELGITGDTYVELSDNISALFPFVVDVTKAAIITEALNEGWKPNWDNGNERKWYPYFDMRTNSFSLLNVDDYYRFSFVPSRICY